MDVTIRRAVAADAPSIRAIIAPVVRAGETYALDPAMGEDEALAYWLSDDRETFVLERGGLVLGTYYLRANQPGGGSHVANCGYMTAAQASGQGIGRMMCADSLDRARARGFLAMQFNFVVSTNVRAISLWQSMGFTVIGTVPGAFRHPALGLVDALVMHRAL